MPTPFPNLFLHPSNGSSIVEQHDTVTEEKDKSARISNEWDLLMNPLIQVLGIKSLEPYARDLYVATPSKEYTLNYPRLRNAPMVDLRVALADSVVDPDFLANLGEHTGPDKLPLVLIGEPGVGKSTWITRVSQNAVQSKIHCIRYNHDEQIGSLISASSAEEKIQIIIRGQIIQILIECAAAHPVELPNFPAFSADEQKVWTENTATRVKQAIRLLRDAKIKIWLAIDNLDRFPLTQQNKALEIARYCSSVLGITTIVPIRPYTYRDGDWRENTIPIVITPPDIKNVISKRLSLLRQYHDDRFGMKTLLDFLHTNTIHLSWMDRPIGATATPSRPQTLKEILRLYTKITKVICLNQPLCRLIYSLRHYNIRKVVFDFGWLLKTSFVEQYVRDALLYENNLNSNRRKPGEYELITAYLRGPYRRHRGGRSGQHKINVPNVFQAPLPPHAAMLAVRILQVIKVKTSDANGLPEISYVELVKTMAELSYEEKLVSQAIFFLGKRRLIQETRHFYDLGTQNGFSVKPEGDDYHFVLSSSGKYYFESFFDREAFRYLDAMSDVTHFPNEVFSRSLITTSTEPSNVAAKVFLMLKCIHNTIMAERHQMSTRRYVGDVSRWEDLLWLLHNEAFLFRLTKNVQFHMDHTGVHLPQHFAQAWATFRLEVDQLNQEREAIVKGRDSILKSTQYDI